MAIGKMYCSDGDVDEPQCQTDYVVPVKDIKKEDILQECKKYIIENWDRKGFESKRGITIEDMLSKAKLHVSYERYIPINENSFDYDTWGSGVYRLYPNGGKGATKVWALTFTDNPFADWEDYK